MSKEIFIKLMNALGKIYGKEIDKELLEIWYSYFAENTTNEFKEAVNEYIKTKSRFPTIADIKENIAKSKLKEVSSAEDEWNNVINLVHKFGSYNENKALEEMNEYTRYITKLIGFTNICLAEDNTWNKKEFISEYNALLNKKKELLQIDFKNDKLIVLKEEN